ncbi:toxin-antitoxin system YwqK family antitoxin [Tenacibaculum sp. MEBiC06402]|uniref:toxin-antitoxin system YwqK family antitoxin n=1 Tax=unclassified Tenacibaculum TaxID=2635139 RepID=UPI003B999534
MKIRLVIALFLLILSSTCFAQKFYQKNYFENGKIKSEGWIENDKKENYWVFYYKNGNIKEKGHYIKGLRDKYWYFYNRNSSKDKEGHFVKGQKNKWWLFYGNDGNVNHKCQLKNNKKNGYCLIYKRRKLIKASKFKDGKKIKEWKDFSSFKRENNLNDLK